MNSLNNQDFKNQNENHENLINQNINQLEDINVNCQNNLTVMNMPKMTVWNPNDIVIDALKYHATVGDVQTAASVLLVLGEKRVNFTNLDENVIEHWLLGYIELLCRYRLWNIATQVSFTLILTFTLTLTSPMLFKISIKKHRNECYFFFRL